MKRILSAFLAAVFFLSLTVSASAEEEKAAGKVIFDTDIAYLNDDTIALFMLCQADRNGDLELLGVCTVGGNVFAAEATTAALRQLELIERTDIPVYQGTDVPLAGFRNMEEESKIYGVPRFCGAYWDFGAGVFSDMEARPTDYHALNKEPFFGYAEKEAESQNAWDFMIEQVHRYPGEVTIMSVGPATNVATAIKKDPDFVKDAAGIIYMGGDIDVPGNATPAAEMNWFYDPDAIRLCLGSDWKSQIVVPDDLARQIRLTQSVYDCLSEREQQLITALILTKQKTFDGEAANYAWDVVVPAIYLKPELILDLQTRYLTVETESVLNSGRAVSWEEHSHNSLDTGEGMPEGVRPVQIVMKIDEEAFWDFYIDLLSQ